MLRPGDQAPPLDGQPVFGLPVRIPAEATGPTESLALFFLASLNLPTTRAAIQDLQRAVADFTLAGVRPVVVTRSSLPVARDFVPRHHLLLSVVCDPFTVGDGGHIFPAWGVGRDPGLRHSLGAAARGGVDLRVSLRTLAHGFGRLERPLDQLPASFLVGMDGRIRWASYARSVLESPDVAALLAAGR